MGAQNPLIRTEHVSMVFHPGLPDEMRAVSDVSVEIAAGEFLVLKGPSGSGKTTLLSLLGCMTRPTQGRIVLHGKDVAKLPERFLTQIRRKEFGFIFQQFNLIRGLSVLENVMLPLCPTEVRIAEMRRRAESLLDELNMRHKAGQPIQRLSGGEQQRVAIARALVNEPAAILADEPTAHLDTRLSEDFMQIMHRLNRAGKTVIVASHDPRVFAKPFITRVVEMQDGAVSGVAAR